MRMRSKLKLLQYKTFFFFLVLVGLNACKTLHPTITFDELMLQRSDAAKQLHESGENKQCEINSKQYFDDFILHNNLWGKSRLKGDSATLCTYQSGSLVGWEWQMPKDAKGVIGYPSIMLGSGPWKVERKLHGFPVQIDSVQVLQVDYGTEMFIKGKKYNLAFDLWLSSAFRSTAETVTTEIMVWEDYNDFRSFGKKVEDLQSPFGVYEVMKGYLKNEKFGQNWQYFAFVSKDKRQSGSVDLKYFLDYLVREHDVDPEQFITSVEFGNEIGNSSGFTLVKKFDWIIE